MLALRLSSLDACNNNPAHPLPLRTAQRLKPHLCRFLEDPRLSRAAGNTSKGPRSATSAISSARPSSRQHRVAIAAPVVKPDALFFNIVRLVDLLISGLSCLLPTLSVRTKLGKSPLLSLLIERRQGTVSLASSNVDGLLALDLTSRSLPNLLHCALHIRNIQLTGDPTTPHCQEIK